MRAVTSRPLTNRSDRSDRSDRSVSHADRAEAFGSSQRAAGFRQITVCIAKFIRSRNGSSGRHQQLAGEVRLDGTTEIQSAASQHRERDAAEQVEVRRKRAVRKVLHDFEPARVTICMRRGGRRARCAAAPGCQAIDSGTGGTTDCRAAGPRR